MENHKRIKKVDMLSMVLFLIVGLLIMFFVSQITNFFAIAREVITAFLLNVFNLLVIFFIQKKAFMTNDFVTWGLIAKGIKSLFFVAVLILLTVSKFFENNKAFFLFFLGFFLLSFMIELILLNYKKGIA